MPRTKAKPTDSEGPAITPVAARREDLYDVLKCPLGHEHPTHILPDCHPDEPVFATYDRVAGVLELYCSVCETGILSVQVASRERVM